MSNESKAIKVAILGGGVGAMTAAFALTDPSLNNRYDVTVYQLGWRLGGKGASGRDMQNHDRIMEHGLHVWLGCYDNSFHIMRQCYAELGRSPEDPLGTVEKAFHPQSRVALLECFNGQWLPWEFNFPATNEFPGQRKKLPTLWDFLLKALEWIPELLHPHIEKHLKDDPRSAEWSRPEWWNELIGDIESLRGARARFVGHEPLYGAIKLARVLDQTPQEAPAEIHQKLHALLSQFKGEIQGHILDLIGSDRELYHLWILLDLAVSNILGILADRLLHEPFETINQYDYREWLGRHGADPLTLDSAPLRVLYELVFAYENGITQGSSARMNLEAGTLLQGLPRIALGYTGAFLWLMQSGMGDSVFAPLYQVLQRRGVKFNFFSRVTCLNVEGDELTGIEISRQINLNVGEYDPLILVKGLPCWPGEPLYNQIVEGEILRRDQINLESFWTPWVDTGGTIHLKAGEDFDHVVLGISLGALPFICQPWIQENPRWQAMVSNIQTVQTQAAQLWLSPTLTELGYSLPDSVNGTFTITALDTWADMSHLIASENWSASQVNTIAYFTGPMPGPSQPPPATDHQFEAQMKEQARQTARDLAANQLKEMWTNFGWEALIAPSNVQGPDRLNYQFMRANADPSERYVQTVRNSTRYRLRADQSGIKRLVLAGDWTENGLNLGCVEAATVSGMQAAQAISGFPTVIVGENPHMEKTMPNAVYPKYVEHGGELSYPAPVVCEGTNLYGFILQGDRDKLTTFCRKVFREPSGGRVDYIPLTHFVMLTIGKINKIYSSSLNVGWSPETQAIFWVPVVAGRQVGPVFVAERVALLPAYVVVHDLYSLVSGREVYGFFKSYGWIDLPDSDKIVNPQQLKLDVYGMNVFDPKNEAQRWPLLEVNRIGDSSGATGSPWTSLEDAFQELRSTMKESGREMILPGLSVGPNLISDLLHKEVPVAFLKQFRDAGTQGGAAYQAILEAPAIVQRLAGFRLIDEYQFTLVNRLDSYPLANDLGLSSQKALMSFKLDMDFTFYGGKVIWQAGQSNNRGCLSGLLARLFGAA